MKLHRKCQVIPLSLLAVVTLVCISCQRNTQPKAQTAAQDIHIDKCKVDLPLPPSYECTLSKFWDHRIVWNNPSGQDRYVCFNPDPTKNPFEAYAWLVPKQDHRKSGKIRDDVTPTNPPQYYEFYDSPSPCVWPQPGLHPLTNPKIIITQ
jgi:hypothetical protein